MTLREKMFDRMRPGCGFRTECREIANSKFFGDLFKDDWEVFVIRHDKTKGKYEWFTQCCEELDELCKPEPKRLAALQC